MNLRHLSAILWLRGRMSLHQTRRAGVASAVVLAILAVALAAVSVGLFFLGLVGGVAAFSRLPPEGVMLVWDGAALAFVFFWTVGLVAELQRSEVLSLQKLLHLPISLSGAFLLNYLGSLARLSVAVFLPGMVGLGIALVIVKGPKALLVFPLLAGFLLMVTALSYQFQGWLASLMMNKRRRRTIIFVVSISFMVVSQLPNLFNARFGFGRARHDALWAKYEEEVAGIDRARDNGDLTAAEHGRLSASARSRYEAQSQSERQARNEKAFSIARRLNLLLPPGWLPYGALGCARGEAIPALLGALGLGLIGAASLRRSYGTTLRMYSGHFTARAGQHPPAKVPEPKPARAAPASAGLLERELPSLSEHAAAVALMSFRSLTRAPEARIALLTPIILVFLYGSMALAGKMRPPEVVRPFVGLGAIAVVLLSVQQLISNQFGLDRDGFRALVLSPSPRREVLLGKNLAMAPIALGMGLVLLAIAQAVFPMRVDHLAGTVAALVSTYLFLCMVANQASILAPVPLASGSLKPAHPKLGVVLVQLVVMLFLPVVIGIATLPLGFELLFDRLGWMSGVPLYLLCALPELGVAVWLYRRAIGWQGRLLQAREQRVLAVVTTKVE